jgi:hypothetical protein
MKDGALREHLTTLLNWHDAHADFDTAVADLPAAARGRTPAGAPYSPWQLLEHIRIAQHDILDFCTNPSYVAMEWPDDYWPAGAAPPGEDAWGASIAACVHDREALQAMVRDSRIDLFATIPHGSGQTYLREVLLVADHTAYHLGQLVAVRKLLGVWAE